jgi:SAM-dependent methyltransferase
MRSGRFTRLVGGGVRQMPALLVSIFFERRSGPSTMTNVDLEELGLAHPDRVGYIPAGWLTLRRILRGWDVSNDDVFLDLGSGKGRAVLFAARYPFRRVIGVEISPDLHAIAEANVRQSKSRLKCRNIELVNEDVLDYRVPDDVTVVFLFNPFRGRTFDTAIERVLQSIDACPRSVKVIYVNPFEEESLLATGRATLVRIGRRHAGAEFRVYELR